ncbi:MAG TPA: PKD domain-containing protein [Thermoleophilaceae bacterium]|jgi:hypothetical protein
MTDRGSPPRRGRTLVVALVVSIAGALAFGIVGAFGNGAGGGSGHGDPCPPGGYGGPGYGGPGYGGPGYGGPGYGGPGYGGPGYGGPGYGGPGYGGPGYGGPGYGGPGPCPPCPPPGNGNGNGHDDSNGQGHGQGQGRGHCKDDSPTATFTFDPSSPEVGQTVHFSGSADTDGHDPIVSWQWDFDGDGQFDDGSGQEIDHVFTSPGKVDVGLLVTDAGGQTDTYSHEVNVHPAKPKDPGPKPKDPEQPKDPGPKPKDPEQPTDPGPKAKDPSPTPPVADTTPPKVKAAATSGQKLSEVASKGLSIAVSCSEACGAKLTVAYEPKGSKGPKLKGAAASVGKRLTAARRTTIRVKLTSKARKALRRKRSATFALTIAAVDDAGNKAGLTRRVTIKR